MRYRTRQPLKVWRIMANLSQEQFAEAIGVDRATVSLWENGKAQPRAENIAKIEKVLKVKWFDDVIVPKV